MRQRVTTTYTLERLSYNGDGYSTYNLCLVAEFAYAPSSADDPGEFRLELDRVTCGGEPFDLTTREEQSILDYWAEELRDEAYNEG